LLPFGKAPFAYEQAPVKGCSGGWRRGPLLLRLSLLVAVGEKLLALAEEEIYG